MPQRVSISAATLPTPPMPWGGKCGRRRSEDGGRCRDSKACRGDGAARPKPASRNWPRKAMIEMSSWSW